MPGATSGRVTRRKVWVSLAYRSIAACSSLGSRLWIRAFTATMTKLMQNITCAMTIVVKPRLKTPPRLRNRVSSDAAITTSGVAIGRKISMLITVRPPNRCRASANATIVPRTVEITVEVTPMIRLFWTDWQTSGAPHGFDQFFSVNPFQMMLERPPSLNENTVTYAIGRNRYRKANTP